jgi:predicted nicotinamide N-methyase
MSKVEIVEFPSLGNIQLVIQSKRDIRGYGKDKSLDAEGNEWFYWNRIWVSEIALSEILIQEFFPDSLKGKTILELGCGTGLAGMVCGKLGGVPTFSDKVPMVMESIREACSLNALSNYHTLVLDWANSQGLSHRYDMVLGSEIFYDNIFLKDICQLLDQVLPFGGTGLFCDPNRLGFDTVEACFGAKFHLTISEREVEWPREPSIHHKKKTVFLYRLVKKETS